MNNPSNSQIEEWHNDADVLLDAGWSKGRLLDHLQLCGCPYEAAIEIFRAASGRVRARHRAKGMRSIGIGVVLIVVGAIVVYFAHEKVQIGGERYPFGVGAIDLLVAPVLPAIGVIYVIGGLYKLLTGSTIEIED